MLTARVLKILSDWQHDPPADEAAIEEFSRLTGVKLPPDYLALLRKGDGYSGTIKHASGEIRFRSARDLLDATEDENFPGRGYLEVAHDSGSSPFLLDLRKDPPWWLDGNGGFIYCGSSLEEFLESMRTGDLPAKPKKPTKAPRPKPYKPVPPKASQTKAGVVRRLADANFIHAACFNADGTQLLVVYNGDAQLLNTATGQVISRIDSGDYAQRVIRFTEDDRALILRGGCDRNNDGGVNPPLQAWDVGASCASGNKIDGQEWGHRYGAFSPDGGQLALISETVGGLWDLTTGQRLMKLARPDYSNVPLAFTPDGARLFISTQFQPLPDEQRPTTNPAQWMVFTSAGKYLGWFLFENTDNENIADLHMLSDGRMFTYGGGRAALWPELKEVQQQTISPLLVIRQPALVAAVCLCQGALIATLSKWGLLTMWDGRTGAKVDSLEAPIIKFATLAASPDGRYLVMGGCNDKLTTLWDLSPLLPHDRVV